MTQLKTKQEAEEHIKQIAEDVAKKFEKDMMQMSDEELDSLRKRLNYTVSEAQCKRMNEDFHREQAERRKNLPKEEQVLYDTYIELLDQSLISGFCHYAYIYLDKDGKYQLGGSTLNSILGVPFIRFCSDMQEKIENLNKYDGTFVCFWTYNISKSEKISEDCFRKLHETYDFPKFFHSFLKQFIIN